MAAALHEEFRFYLENQEALAAKFDGQVVVITQADDPTVGFTVLGPYTDDLEAIEDAQRRGHVLGTFLVQKVSRQTEPWVFHSRVRFT